MTTREPLLIGPFIGGLNNFDDQSSIKDSECFEALNFDMGTDGSLKSRPPMIDLGKPIVISPGVAPKMLGYFYDTSGNPYLIASDGSGKTYRFYAGAWSVITSTFAATDMTQFDGKAWLVAPPGSSNPGGYWTPSGGFVADSAMPKGESITAYKSRLFIAAGQSSSTPTRMYYSKVLGQSNFWSSPAFVEVGSGDGQALVKIITYFDAILVFRTESIWEFQYGTDPATAIASIIVPGVGLTNRFCLAIFESYIYFMYDENMYEFANNKANKINDKVVFQTADQSLSADPYSVSVWNSRVLCSFFENVYVFSLRTRAWTQWKSDVWGAVGQVLSPASDKPNREGYLFSKSGVNRSEYDRNLIWNPNAATNTSYVGTSTRAKDLARSTTVPGAPTCFTWGITEATSCTLRWENTPVTPGQTLVLKAKVRALQAGSYTTNCTINWLDSTGNPGTASGTILSGVTGSAVSTAGNEWVEVTVTGTAPVGAAYARGYVGFQSIDSVDDKFAAYNMSLTTNGEYFDGGTAADATYSYRWSGAANGSPSIKYLGGSAPLLKINEQPSADGEAFQCVLTTKNYSFSVPGAFKVLFWWGVDAIFRGTVQGYATPVTYSQAVTWGQIYNQGKTWGRLLNGTWGRPFLPDPSVITTVTSTGSGLVRKFVKFLKKLRFRQISFKVIFDTDGSYVTAPIMLFTISAYMAKKQTVSKQIS